MTDHDATSLTPDEDRRLWRPDGPLRWLVSHGVRYPETAALMKALCARLVAEGIPLLRASWAIRTIHPQVRGATYLWQRGGTDVMETLRLHSITDDPAYIDSPFRTLFETGQPLRRNLAAGETDFPLLKEIRAEGGTDYLALPMTFEGGWINALAWTTDRPNGFLDSEINLFKALCPVLSGRVDRPGAGLAAPPLALDGKDRQHAVADEFQHVAAMPLDRVDHAFEEVVQRRHDLGRRRGLGHFGKALDVGRPQDGPDDLAVAPANPPGKQAVRGMAAEIGREQGPGDAVLNPDLKQLRKDRA